MVHITVIDIVIIQYHIKHIGMWFFFGTSPFSRWTGIGYDIKEMSYYERIFHKTKRFPPKRIQKHCTEQCTVAQWTMTIKIET